MRTIALTEETRKNVLENLLKRSPSSYGKFEDAVAEIVENVNSETLDELNTALTKMRQCLNIRKDLTVPISMPETSK